jgi:hypothetical protein
LIWDCVSQHGSNASTHQKPVPVGFRVAIAASAEAGPDIAKRLVIGKSVHRLFETGCVNTAEC